MSSVDQTRPDPRASGDCAWRDSAAAHVLGALDADESARFLAHTPHCPGCAAELARAERDVALLDEQLAAESLAVGSLAVGSLGRGSAATADAPRADGALRERLLRALGSTPQDGERVALDRTWRRWQPSLPVGASTEGFPAGMYAVAGDQGLWEPVGIPGIEVKKLAADPARRSVTMLVRMGPGTAYPRHRHGGLEECFVLSGELQVGERMLRAGDYQSCQENSVHAVQSTREGCLLYITSSQDDELV